MTIHHMDNPLHCASLDVLSTPTPISSDTHEPQKALPPKGPKPQANGKSNGNYYLGFRDVVYRDMYGLYRDNGKENGSYYNT